MLGMKLTLTTTAAGLATGITLGLVAIAIGITRDVLIDFSREARAVAASR